MVIFDIEKIIDKTRLKKHEDDILDLFDCYYNELKNLPKHEDLLIIDVFEVEKLWPLNELESKTIYNLHKSLLDHTGKIYYLSSDLNFIERYNKWLLYKDLLFSNLKEKFIPYIFPFSIKNWTVNPTLTNLIDEISKKSKSKNFINLTCCPKLLRLLLLDRYYQHEYFEYSYFPWYHGSKNDFKTYSIFKPIEWYNGQKIKAVLHSENDLKILWKNPIDTGFLHDSAPFKELTESKRLIKFFSIPDSEVEEWKKFDKLLQVDVFECILPVEVFMTNCDVVTESYLNDDSVFFTEKTFKEFIYKRPFLLFGAKNQNTFMKKLGFELYDEIFDYEFDTLNTVEQRFNAFCKQIDRYIDMKPEKLEKILTCLDDKIEHNFNHLLNEYKKSENINLLISSNYGKKNMFVRDKSLDELFKNLIPLFEEYENKIND